MSKRYGLIVPERLQTKKISAISGNSKPLIPKVFEQSSSSDSEKDESSNLFQIQKIQQTGIGPSIMGRQIAKKICEKALSEDPTIFMYDELYEDMNSKREEITTVKKNEPKAPKYIQKLLETAERRKIENELRVERQVQKEREAEGEQFKDKEAFVTSTYRKKLEEMRHLQEQHERDNYLESIGDATKQKDGLDSFYRHLYEQKLGNDKKSTIYDNNLTKKLPITEELQYMPIKSKKSLNKKVYRKRQLSEDDETIGNSPDYDTILQRDKGQHLSNNIDADSDFSIDESSTESETEVKNCKSKIEVSNKDSIVVNTATINSSLQMLPSTVALQFGSLAKEKEQTNLIKLTEIKENFINKDSKEDEERAGDKNNMSKEIKNNNVLNNNVSKNTDIWRKKTVGEVFKAAVQRYQERRVLRHSYINE